MLNKILTYVCINYFDNTKNKMKKNTKGGRRQPEERLQRRPDLPRSRLRRRPDGQERVPHTNREI